MTIYIQTPVNIYQYSTFTNHFQLLSHVQCTSSCLESILYISQSFTPLSFTYQVADIQLWKSLSCSVCESVKAEIGGYHGTHFINLAVQLQSRCL